MKWIIITKNFENLTVAGPLTCFLQKSYILIDFLWSFFGQLTDRKFSNFKTAVMTGPAAFNLVQNPVKFEKFDKMTKNWQKITFNVKSLVILRRETRQISVELLIWKIPNFSQRMAIFKIVSLSPPCKGKFHRKFSF